MMVGVGCISRSKSHPASCTQSETSETRKVDLKELRKCYEGMKFDHDGHGLLVNKLLLRFPKPHEPAYPVTLLLVRLVGIILLGTRLDG